MRVGKNAYVVSGTSFRGGRIIAFFNVMLAVCLFAAASVQAWNATGHMTVAELAWRNLPPAKRSAISALLKQHPHYTLLLTKEMDAAAETPEEWVFITAATWPDMVRPSRDQSHAKPFAITNYHRGDWHFIDFPYLWPADADHMDITEYAPPVTNALWAISNAVATLKDTHATAPARAVSLCWLLHLIGDIHQPLHCAKMYSDDFKHGDSGGNSLAVTEPGKKPTPLHTLWDDLLGKGESYHFIDGVADSLDTGTPFDAAKQKYYKSHKTYESWVAESHSAARSYVYLDGDLEFAKWNLYESKDPAKHIPAEQVPVLSTTYMTNANDLAHRRVALGGRRLADVLKKLF